MLVGETMSGKSSLLHSLGRAIAIVNEEKLQACIDLINPKAITIG
jgi:ABC-type phosphate/phosphonate transport system ATPase subunit